MEMLTAVNNNMGGSAPVTVALEVEPELEDAVLELTLVAVLMVNLPFTIDALESNVFIRRSRVEANHAKVLRE